MLADERLKRTRLGSKELVEVWHSDGRKETKSRQSARKPASPASRPATSTTVQQGGDDNLDNGEDTIHGAAAVELEPYSGPRAAEMEKI
eukprot:COSAG02_NODE_48794_length_331_cov_0.879310_1_plen_88_part_01